MENIEIFKALANEHRLQILFWLKNPTAYFVHDTDVDMVEIGVCVGEIQKKLGLTQSTTSHYLSILQKSNLLIATRIGKWTYYRRNEVTLANFRSFVEQDL
ncbi:ArsR/SmtB family transcription factor (plasmid) [Enterococcus sp. 22-H-5-01]|uniref:ArsR/SmtB family transcription factor n=1 Tax=Enterococcus sp. 22-H-5-01 TaxID=3418555 RepID=UPI003D063A39